MSNVKWAVLLLLGILCFQSATADNPVVIGNSRFTFITDRLVRLEYALDGKFLDDSTLFAVNRIPECTDVKVEKKEGNRYTLTTPAMRVEYYNDGFPFGQTNLFVYFRNGANKEEKRWNIANEQSWNLSGALTTLDAVNGSVERQEGLLSRDGWYVINDTGKEIIKNGWVVPRDRSHVQDLYLFVYGTDYKAALKSLRTISGPAPMTRKSPLDEFPLFVKGGYPLPMQPYTERMCSTPLTELVVRCYPGQEGVAHSYTLYEDDGLTTAYRDGYFATTELSYRKNGSEVQLAIGAAAGNYTGQPLRRAYRIELPGVAQKAQVKVDGKRAKAIFDATLGGLVITVKTRDIRKPVQITVLE